jgi:hypothetical protein
MFPVLSTKLYCYLFGEIEVSKADYLCGISISLASENWSLIKYAGMQFIFEIINS